nr:uncharacterized protein LOC117686956 [Crassostrea gigas]
MTGSKVRADHMIRSCRIRAIRPSLKMETGKIVSVILLLTIVYCYGTKGAKCPPCPLWYGIYKCNSPRFSSCVTLRWQPGLREISLFNCRVQMIMIGWKNGVRPIMRDRFQKICTETTKRTVTTTTTTATTTKEAKSTLSEKHEVTSSVMETTTKETTSANLPRRHPLKTRHSTVNTPPTDVTLIKKHEVTSSVMETTTKETTSANLPRRHPLKTRHSTVNTPPTDVTLIKKHEVTSSVMETTTKETTSTNLPRRHHLKTRHLTVNTPPTDVTLVKKHGTSIDDLKNKVVNAINAESAKEHGSLTDMALGKHIEPYFNFMLFNSNILFISNRCTY